MGDQKLREKMRRSSAGWRLRELHRLYRSYGFHRREGSKHVIYHHPAYPQLRATVARHDPLRNVYVRDALDLIDRLEAAGGVR